ncbi:MAG TPA: MSMEG_0567/Sll0786 family nitrogen starvation N-acetyltransferase [Acidimicrobiales bacterium]|nr:MSMEG_0567/Sll0786 family nitrogen starvation N-acetyltransferase [Acidimicrobiales bacterium]
MPSAPSAPDLTEALHCAIAGDAAAVELHHRIRHAVFVEEQAVFSSHDRDDHDTAAATIKVLGFCGDAAAGAVRLYPIGGDDSRDWQGDRLAVLPAYRRHRLGGPLVEFAVTTAARRGGRRMIAHIQLPNVRFFERLGWVRAGAVETYVGLPHQPMEIDLTRR